MLVYRVFPHLDGAEAGAPGHPGYLHHPQGAGRLDNPDRYSVWYLAAQPSAAIGEVFGDFHSWTDAMFGFPALPGARRALGVFSIADDAPLLELDDAASLLERGLRPTQVISRNRAETQGWARRIHAERAADDTRRYAGVRWWSYRLPSWQVLGLWGITPDVVVVEPLGLAHPALIDAAAALRRQIVPG